MIHSASSEHCFRLKLVLNVRTVGRSVGRPCGSNSIVAPSSFHSIFIAVPLILSFLLLLLFSFYVTLCTLGYCYEHIYLYLATYIYFCVVLLRSLVWQNVLPLFMAGHISGKDLVTWLLKGKLRGAARKKRRSHRHIRLELCKIGWSKNETFGGIITHTCVLEIFNNV